MMIPQTQWSMRTIRKVKYFYIVTNRDVLNLTNLCVAVHVPEDLVDLVLEPTVQHLISLVEYKHLDALCLQVLEKKLFKCHKIQQHCLKMRISVIYGRRKLSEIYNQIGIKMYGETITTVR